MVGLYDAKREWNDVDTLGIRRVIARIDENYDEYEEEEEENGEEAEE